jgi:hypothetical protein
MVGKIAMGQVFLGALRIPLSNIIPPLVGWYNVALLAVVPRAPPSIIKKQWIFIILNNDHKNL